MQSTDILKRFFLFALLGMCSLSVSAGTYNVLELGADGQGKEKCTEIIQKAIKLAADDGGGTVFFPAGEYLTGPIHLQSNITLEVQAGAHVQFTGDFDDYLPYVKMRYEGYFMKSFSPLIYAVGVENITIKGEGTMDGNGKYWWAAHSKVNGYNRYSMELPSLDRYQSLWEEQNPDLTGTKYERRHFFRPPFIQFIECSNIDIEGITIRNSPFWTINPVGCNDVHIHGVTISNPPDGYNTDGVNPSSCSNVRISDCLISVGDDCVTIKSGRDQFGRDYGKPCENITVTNCVMLAGHGGVVIGSETSGGVKNVTISNCVFDGTDNGIRLKSARGRGGIVENIRVTNIVMRNIQRTAFVFNLLYERGTRVEPVSERTPVFRNIHISNVTGVDVARIGGMTGIEEMPVEEVSFSNVNIKGKTGFIAKTAKNLHFSNVDFCVEQGPSFSFTDCDNITLDDIRSSCPLKDQAILEIRSSGSILINNCFQPVPTSVFSEIDDSEVYWENNLMSNVEQEVQGGNRSNKHSTAILKDRRRYNVAAYIWPSCHHDERFGDMLWPEKTGEWEIIRRGTPRFEGHYQPKEPMWGYELDDDPKVMEKWIDAATDHGINTFIFDWYWFDEGPFLEGTLNKGFLGASNHEKMNFYLMWANHDVKQNYWNVYQYQDTDTLLWDGAVDLENFKIIVDRVINHYFKQPNYFKIEGMPVFSIFSLDNLIEGLGGVPQTREALDYFRERTKEAGFPGLHLQLIIYGLPGNDRLETIETLQFNSATQYNWGWMQEQDYIKWATRAIGIRDRWDDALNIPFFPNASIGWDDTPRFPQKGEKDIVHYNKSPESFATYLQEAKKYCDKHPGQPGLITIFSWNEWVEGGYLLPDRKYGFEYLKKVKEVTEGSYDPYSD